MQAAPKEWVHYQDILTCNPSRPDSPLKRPPTTAKNLRLDVMPAPQAFTRRFASRVAGPLDLWVFWNRKKHDGLSRVLNLSVGGLCLSIDKSERMAVGEKVHLNFLTPEGQIRTDAIVRHIRPERLGLKFIAIREEDRAHLTALVRRLRSVSRPQAKSGTS